MTLKNPLYDSTPFPAHYINPDKYSDHPSICYNFHPVMGTKICELQIKKENIIFNDIVQEGHLTNQAEFYLALAKKYIDNAKSTEKIVENIIHLLTEPNTFFEHLHKTLCEQTSATFLGSLVFTLNSAIRKDFLNFKSDRRCFRKAFLSLSEITEYYIIHKSESKRFCWNSFATAYLESPNISINEFETSINDNNTNNVNINNFSNNDSKLLNYNAVFVIDFKTDAFGVNIESYSSSGIKGEILLPAMSLFEIRKIESVTNQQGREVLRIDLLKIDQNPISKHKKTLLKKEKDLSKIMKVMQNELLLLKVAEAANKDNFVYVQDEADFFLIKLALSGPIGTPYESRLFQVNLEITKHYPNEAPKVFFMTKIWHPNICFETGILKHVIFKRKWKPSNSLANVVEFIISILRQPEIYEVDCANSQAGKEFFENKKMFEIKARQFTNEYTRNMLFEENPNLLKNFTSKENLRNLLKNDLLSSLNRQNNQTNKNNDNKHLLDIGSKNNNNCYNESNDSYKQNNVKANNTLNNNFQFNNNNTKDNILKNSNDLKIKNFEREIENAQKQRNNTNNAMDKSADEVNDGMYSETIENSVSNRNEAIEKEDFQRVRSPEIYELYRNSYDLNNKNLQNENQNKLKIYNGNNRIFITDDEFEEAENFEMKADNDVNIAGNLKGRITTENTGNGSQGKMQHSNYEVEFDSRKDIDLSENIE